MEVVVTEEKKKIFRARKTMKISDRQQLETLHNTLLTAGPGSSETSSPPLMNGTHKDDGPKVEDKEQNNVSDSNSPRAASPATPTSLSSPAPFLSLNLSPSPPSSHSPKEKEDAPTSPTSPFHSLNFELKKMGEEEAEGVEKKGSSSSSAKESVTASSKESTENKERDTEKSQESAKTEEKPAAADKPAVDLPRDKDPIKDLDSGSSVSATTADSSEPMDIDSDTTKTKDSEISTAKIKDEKPSSRKSTTSGSSSSCPASSYGVEPKEEKDIKTENIKEEADENKEEKEGSVTGMKMELDSVKVETSKEKSEVKQTTKPSRPSSTPPSNTVQEEKGSTSGLKRTLSEGYEKDSLAVKREGKRPKVEREELEAQLELKITAKAGSHHKLEKIVQQLVDERLRALELTIFNKHFEELKDRVDKIDCATKHQTAINTLQAKIARLAKKFGEANQASENKRKNEALAAAAAAAAAASSTAAAKTVPVATIPQVQRKPRVGMAPSFGETPVLSVKEEEEAEEMEEEEDMSHHIAMAKKLAGYSEGKCRADIKLRTISSHLENVLYQNCKRSSGVPRPDRYASYIFRYLVPYEDYSEWVAKVNYVGLMGKEALPTNVRRTMKKYIERRFPVLSCDAWREVRDAINELLRVKRKADFFREYDARTVVLY